ncbi:MAG: TIGR02710 family CRISPR-associated CARF protein [Rhodobacteraceae bacterium]|nr:TIGR02710 family CRISPR-associated CARF protein [Paracoccaceae bacterium]
MNNSARALVLTVGTGNIDDLENTLFQPLEKSLNTGKWKEAVLLPSTMTANNARKFKDRMFGYSIRIDPLPEEGRENDADACFSHFDKVLSELETDGYRPEAIVPDFTRGTKAMSAALVLAAVRHKIPQLRYIHGVRDNRGMVIGGKEEIGHVMTERASMRRRIDDSLQLMTKGAFASVLAFLPEIENSGIAEALVPVEFRDEISRLRKLAAFWAAWDRLDYKEALTCSSKLNDEDHMALNREIASVECLAAGPIQDNHGDMAEWLRWVATDLLVNGRRRIAQHQFEDALLRAYRIVELIGQVRLFARGYDSARISPKDPCVEKFRQRLKKNGSNDFGCRKEEGRKVLTATRMLGARFLKYLGDSLGQDLVNFDNDAASSIKASDRNLSILTHGFSVANLDKESLSNLYDRIKVLLEKDCPDTARCSIDERFGIVP